MIHSQSDQLFQFSKISLVWSARIASGSFSALTPDRPIFVASVIALPRQVSAFSLLLPKIATGMLFAMKPAAIPEAIIPVPITATYLLIFKPMRLSYKLV